MPFKQVTLTHNQLLEALKKAAEPLLYPSETDAPIEVLHVSADSVGESFTEETLLRLIYPEYKRSQFGDTFWAEMHRAESNGTQKFFRYLLDVIHIHPDNSYDVAEYYQAAQTPHWRALRDVFFDNTIARKWFRIERGGDDSARKDIYAVGRHLLVQVDDDTNEVFQQLGDWFVLTTHVIET